MQVGGIERRGVDVARVQDQQRDRDHHQQHDLEHEQDGCDRERENWLSVLPSSPIAIVAAITVNGAAIPAAVTIVAKAK